MTRLWPLVRREYLERVRTKAFLVGTLLGPLLMAALTILPAVLAGRSSKPLRIAVLDASGQLRQGVEASLRGRRSLAEAPRFELEPAGGGGELSFTEREQRLKQAVLGGSLDGYLLLREDALARSAADYYGRNVSNMLDLRRLEEAVGEAVTEARLAGAGVERERARELTRPLDLRRIRLSAAGEREDRGASFVLSLVLLMLLYTTVIMWGQVVLTSVIEEKANRVSEVMLSAVPATALLAGKLLGVGAVGLTQLALWAGTLAALSALGASGTASLGPGLPEIPPLTSICFVLFFLLGYLLYSSLFAAVGASVNTTHEAQSLAFPVFMPLVLAVMFFPVVLQSPDGTLSVVLSLVPLFAPLLMFLRISVLTPPGWQIALSMLLCLASIALVLFVAARIYRVGILMYGKRPTLPEIRQWLKHR